MRLRPSWVLTFMTAAALLLALLGPAPLSQAAPATPAPASTWRVTRSDDPPPTVCILSNCSLREAIMAADAALGPSTILLHYSTTYTLTIPPAGADDATTGDLNITNNAVSFDFSGLCLIHTDCHAVIRGGPGWHDRILAIENNAAVTMNLVAIEDGHTPNFGGGINLAPGAALTLSNSLVVFNAANRGGGIESQGNLALIGDTLSSNQAITDAGGAVYSFGTLVVDNSTITANQAHGPGGGLAVSGPTNLDNTTISQNTAATDGGGGIAYDGQNSLGQPLVLDRMTIVSNTAVTSFSVSTVFLGGGIADSNALVDVSDSTLGWNQGWCGGGIGLYLDAAAQVTSSAVINNHAVYGGGACGWTSPTAISLTNVSVSGNSAQQDGGGVLDHQLGLYNATISSNMANSNGIGSGTGGGISGGSIVLANSILAGNIDPGAVSSDCDGLAELDSLGYNLIQANVSCTLTGTQVGNLPGVNPQLSPLADNGGPTWTQAIAASSPARNAGNPISCLDALGVRLSTDQRGFGRWDRCDMGAFELQPAALLFLPAVRR